jgi:transcriptional regulator with XRE-family HTH domain
MERRHSPGCASHPLGQSDRSTDTAPSPDHSTDADCTRARFPHPPIAPQIKRYEAGSSEPSAEALRKIARTFAISTDWLLFEEGERAPADDLALQFEAVQQLSDDERAVIREVVKSLIIKYQSRRWDSARPPAPAAKQSSARRTSSASR